MAPDAVAAVLARNSIASIVQEFDNGRVRTRRSRYAYASGVLYLPAWGRPRWLRRAPPIIIECHVSELHGLEEWCYVWARGFVAAPQPAEDTAQNEARRRAVERLSRAIRSHGRTPDAALPSSAIIRVDITELDGVILKLA